jgi:hypothetical protein
MLVGHYIEEHGGTVRYHDLNTGDTELTDTDVYLIGYWEGWVQTVKFPANATVIDPWRKLNETTFGGKIIHYGNTRNRL